MVPPTCTYKEWKERKLIIQLALIPKWLQMYTAIRHRGCMGAWVPMCAKMDLLLADPQGPIHRQCACMGPYEMGCWLTLCRLIRTCMHELPLPFSAG